MTPPNIPEIRQLRYVSDQYIALAGNLEREIAESDGGKPLFNALTIQELGQRWKTTADPGEAIKAIACYLGHISSAAVRLYAIDEQIKDYAPCGSPRWKEYDDDKKDSTKLTKLDQYIHILLRLNAAHSEEPTSAKYQTLTNARQLVIEGLKVSEIKGRLEKAFASIKQDLKKHGWE